MQALLIARGGQRSNETVHFPSEVWPSLCFVNVLRNLRIFYALFYASVKGDLRIFYASINACRLVLRNKTRTLTHAPIRVVRMGAPYCAPMCLPRSEVTEFS